MLDDTLKAQLAAYLERMTQPIELIASLDDSEPRARCANCCRPRSSPCAPDKISARFDGTVRAQALVHSCTRVGHDMGVHFAACRWGMNSPRCCWRCCGPAATRPRSSPR
jgi:alkyl hydroperoxide reductase subunit F